MSANSTLAEGYCTIPYSADGQVQLSMLSQAFSNCAQAGPIWVEVVDLGTYEILYSTLSDDAEGEVSGISHSSWSREIEMKIGALFGFQALVMTGGPATDISVEIHVYPPAIANGSTRPEIVTSTITSGQVKGAFFFIGSERFLIPGMWRIEFRSNGIILAAQRFNIVAPK